MIAAEDIARLRQLFIIGLPGPFLDEETRRLTRQAPPGGFVLFRRNITELNSLLALCQELHSLSPSLPPFIAIDHEGGRVSRLGQPFTAFPPPADLGATGSTILAYRWGVAMGRELRAAGIDLNFAPLLDVLTNPANAVIGNRAFSRSPQAVARIGLAVMRGLRHGGVIPCGKHFPGHGHTAEDSHRVLPRVHKSPAELVHTELYPFRRAIAAGLECLMTAHVLFPHLDGKNPATMSPFILTDLLRGRLGYGGIVITDDLGMGAITSRCSIEEATVAAVRAGADALLICEAGERVARAFAAGERALVEGGLARSRIEQAYHRLVALKNRHFRRPDPGLVPLPSASHQLLAREITEKAGLFRRHDSRGFLPPSPLLP